ncbi:MAG: histidine phosphatase family protein [Clostridia bacterium]|nr:histidine phosphatase family protein [Clostridia bacterium]
MTKIIIVRHGESKTNELGLLVGQGDFPLTALGLAQAEQTAAALADEQIDTVYASDLTRAMQTAAPHAARRGLAVIPDEGLRETYCGDWESRAFADLRENEPELYVGGFCNRFMTFAFTGGETVPQSGERFLRAVTRIAKQNEGKTVLIASHGGVIRVFWAMISGEALESAGEKIPFPTNAAYSVAYFDGTSIMPHAYSCDKHITTVTQVKQ